MSDVIEQLRQYGAAVEEHAVGVAASRNAARPAWRHRRVIALVAASILVVVGVVTSLVIRDGSTTNTVGVSPRQATPPTPPVPVGWKVVTYGPVQFAVPAEWPVYDDGRCYDPSTYGVYLVMPVQSSCSGTVRALNVHTMRVAGDASGFGGTSRQLNGLDALVIEPDPVDNRFQRYAVALPDHEVLIELNFTSIADASTAHDIISTIGVAKDAAPFPVQPPAVPPTAKPGPSEFCTAVEDFRISGLTDPATRAQEALPYFERMRAAAAPESRPPLDVIISWLEQGAPLPKPSEVAQAELQTTQDWARRC